MPVDSVKTTVPGNSGLDFFTFGNVAPGDQVRYAAHLILVYIFTCEFFLVQFMILAFILILITRSLDSL